MLNNIILHDIEKLIIHILMQVNEKTCFYYSNNKKYNSILSKELKIF